MSIYHLNITFHSVILVDVRNIFNSCAERVNLRVNIENSYTFSGDVTINIGNGIHNDNNAEFIAETTIFSTLAIRKHFIF